MPTIAQLKAVIRAHKNANCPAYSRLRKAELEKLVAKLEPNFVFKPIPKKIRKRPKQIRASRLKKSIPFIKTLTAPGKKFKSNLTLKKYKKKHIVATARLARDLITPKVIKKIGGVASMLTGNNIRNPKTRKLMSSISRWLQEVIVRFGFDAQGDNKGGKKTIVDFWLNRIPDQVISEAL